MAAHIWGASNEVLPLTRQPAEHSMVIYGSRDAPLLCFLSRCPSPVLHEHSGDIAGGDGGGREREPTLERTRSAGESSVLIAPTMYTQKLTGTEACTCTYMHTHMHTNVHIHIPDSHRHTRTRAHTHTHVHMYTYTYPTHTDTHIHTHT